MLRVVLVLLVAASLVCVSASASAEDHGISLDEMGLSDLNINSSVRAIRGQGVAVAFGSSTASSVAGSQRFRYFKVGSTAAGGYSFAVAGPTFVFGGKGGFSF